MVGTPDMCCANIPFKAPAMPRTVPPVQQIETVPPPTAQAAVSHNVPSALSSFVGRTREVADVTASLASYRALTVVGPGGAGKTRLAREIAARFLHYDDARFPDGIWWVELAPVRTGADVATAVANVLSVSPTAGRRLVDALVDAVRPQRLLLVLDNCEHVIEDVALLVETMLRNAPSVTILSTSREALAIDGEVAWPVPPLERPPVALTGDQSVSAATLGAFDAVQLFIERARGVIPAFTLTDANANAVATICARLDGLPLALELAAAVLPVLGVDGLVSRLDDSLSVLSRGKRTALPRHRTLRAVLDWSYALLGDDERTLLQRLAVFRGSFTLDAIEEVCVDTDADVIPALGRLVEHSLIEVREEGGEARYRLLETVRQYGSALLLASPDGNAVRRRHAEWITRLAVTAEPALFSPARGRTVERLQHSIDEIRAALTWATGPNGDPTLAVHLAGALGWFWISGASWEEARAILATTLAAADAQGIADDQRPVADRIALGQLMYPIEGLAYFAGDTETILATAARDLAIWDSIDPDTPLTPAQRLSISRGRTLSLQLTGLAQAMRGNGAIAVATMNQSVDVVAATDDPWLLAVMMMRRALVHFYIGDFASAKRDYDDSVPLLRRLGESWFLSLALEGMAMNSLAMGDASSAARHARESVLVLADEPDAWFISRSLDTMAYVLLAAAVEGTETVSEGNATLAARLLGAAEALRRRCGAGILGYEMSRHVRMHAVVREVLSEDAVDDVMRSTLTFAVADAFQLAREYPVDTDPESRPPAPTPASALELRVQVLGPFTIARDGAVMTGDAIPVGKVRELFLFLMLHEQATKDEAGLALWPDASPAQVRNAFHVTLHRLRRQLGSERWIAFDRDRYRLERAPSADVTMRIDVDDLLTWSTRLRQANRRQTLLDPAALTAAREALEGARGELAQGLVADDWLVVHQDRARVAWAEGMDALAQQLAASGAHADALAVSELLVSREPLRESAHRLIIASLVALGESARALAYYDTLVALLQREVGARPAAETRALVERIRDGARH